MNEPKMFFKISLALQTLAFVIGTPYPVKKFMRKHSKAYTAYMEQLFHKVLQEDARIKKQDQPDTTYTTQYDSISDIHVFRANKNVQYTNHGAE